MPIRVKSQSLYRRIPFTAMCIALLVTGLVDVRSAQAQSSGPCDIYASASTACVAAFSTTRALYSSYTGSLYQVTRQSDNTTTNIGVLSDGYANAATQDTFCAGTVCTITEIYDQSSNHNNLRVCNRVADNCWWPQGIRCVLPVWHGLSQRCDHGDCGERTA